MTEKTPVRLLCELTEAMTGASGAATGLAIFSGQSPAFFVIRDTLDLAKEGIMGLAASCAIIAPMRMQ